MKGKSRFKVGKRKLEELYRSFSTEQIGRQYGVCAEIVRRRLHVLGIPTRKSGPIREFNPSRDELEALYQKHSMRQIAHILNVGETVVWERMNEYGIKLRGYEQGGHRKKYRTRTRTHSLNISLAKRGKWAGDKNPNWKGGVYDANLKIRRTGEYRQWKLAALDRTGNRCESCGVANGTICPCCGTKVSLHVHHLKSFALYPESRFDPTNSEVVCPKCHRSRHHGKLGEFGETPNVESRAIPSEAAEG